MTSDLLVKCTGQAKRKRDEISEQFLRRITHLYCSERGIEAIVSKIIILFQVCALKISHRCSYCITIRYNIILTIGGTFSLQESHSSLSL